MDMHPVVSSNVKAVGHDPEDRALYVEFRDGSRYRYEGVSPEVFRALLRAESKGKFIHARIAKRYKFRRMEIDPNDRRAARP